MRTLVGLSGPHCTIMVWLLAPSIPWLGRLLGDIRIERENFRFCFPLMTYLLLSVLLRLVVWIVRWFRG